MSDNQLNHQNLPCSSDWQFGNQSMSMVLPNPSNPIYHGIQMNGSPFPQIHKNSGFSENYNSLPNGKTISLPPKLDMGMFLPTNQGILPPSLSNFPIDSSFIERAVKFSSITAGNFSALMPIDHGSRCESPMNNRRDNVSSREENPNVANSSGNSSSKGLNVKKRIKSGQDMELEQVQEGSQFSGDVVKENVESKPNVECSSSTPTTAKSNGKSAKVSTDEPKQDYIHVRARRGQATNSHSLAERVRRERISERMKYLQDLVPGCSKVTGKAVMLDEIINYVQSLQRQVEFLSMKLSIVNPSIDLNIEGLLSKDILQPRVGQSLVGFLPDLMHSQLLHSQHGLVQTGIPGMVNYAEALKRAVNAQFAAINCFKDPTTQMPNPWETELQNMMQMNFDTNTSPDTQEFSGKPRDAGFPL